MEQVTLTGEGREPLTLSIDPAIRNDIELLELLVSMDDNDFLALARLVKLLLGPEQKAVLYEWLRNDAGRVTVTAVATSIRQIFDQMTAETKK